MFQQKYIEMRFHGNQISWAIKHPFIVPCFKYHSPNLICSSTMLAPVISSLDKIYCTSMSFIAKLWTHMFLAFINMIILK